MVVVDVSTPNDRRLTPGREFTVQGQGRYRVVRLRLNGEVNAWGPIDGGGNTPKAGMRTFRTEQITRYHYKRKCR